MHWEDKTYKQYQLTQGKANIITWLDADLRVGNRVTIVGMEGWWRVSKIYGIRKVESTCRDYTAWDAEDIRIMRTYFK